MSGTQKRRYFIICTYLGYLGISSGVFFPKHASGMRGFDIHMVENPVHTLAAAAAGAACLRQPSRKFGTCLSKPVVSSRRDAKLRFIETRHNICGLAQIIVKNATAEHF